MIDTRTNSPELWRDHLPSPTPEDNKYSRGFAFVLGGEHKTGAAALASRAAQRIGAGVVTIACPTSAANVYRILNCSAITQGFHDTSIYKEYLEDERIDAFLAGPGLGDESANTERIFAMLRRGKPTVLDADALNIMAHTRDNFFATLDTAFSLEERKNIILTPHRGEFSKLFPEFADQPALEAAQNAANFCGTTVILKGHNTHITQKDQPCCVNRAASPWLTTAGSGDVLSGLCLGLLAQGVPAYTSCCIACAFHSRAATLHGPGLVAEDLNDMIPIVLASFLPARSPSP
ncbi:MAG: NAD(P)H-hydrate dehydratase [Alphaproteobacteria bacterium]|nr:NAD(P)H-hydrate dehydratase [Alphaproteobacteria bacterium]